MGQEPVGTSQRPHNVAHTSLEITVLLVHLVYFVVTCGQSKWGATCEQEIEQWKVEQEFCAVESVSSERLDAILCILTTMTSC